MGVMEIFLTVVATLIGSAILAEAKAWGPRLNSLLIRLSARRLPESMRERAIDDWESMVHDQPGPISKFICAVWLPVASVALEPIRIPQLPKISLRLPKPKPRRGWLVEHRIEKTPRMENGRVIDPKPVFHITYRSEMKSGKYVVDGQRFMTASDQNGDVSKADLEERVKRARAFG